MTNELLQAVDHFRCNVSQVLKPKPHALIRGDRVISNLPPNSYEPPPIFENGKEEESSSTGLFRFTSR